MVVPNCAAGVLHSKKAKKMHVLDRLHSDMSHSAVGRAFNVNESVIDIKCF